jgi:hypothetical protein
VRNSDLKMYNWRLSAPCVVVEIIVRAVLFHFFALLEDPRKLRDSQRKYTCIWDI